LWDCPGVLQHGEVLALRAAQPELADGRGAVGEEAGAIVVVHPGPGHDLGAVEGPEVVLERLDHGVDHVAGDQTLLHQQGLDGRDPPLDGARLGRMVPVILAHVSSLTPGTSPTSRCAASPARRRRP
jgi:hypothetical protein